MSSTLAIGNGHLSMVLALTEAGMPEILYFGPGSPQDELAPIGGRASRTNGMDHPVPSAVLLPVGGAFYGWPAIAGHRDGRDFVVAFSRWTTEGNATRALLSGEDLIAELSIEIEIEAHDAGVIAMRTRLTNRGAASYTLDRLMAGSLLLDAGPAHLTTFTGMWGREMHVVTAPVPHGLWLQENRRGRTSHDRWPGLFVSQGAVTLGLHLGWSGNHQIALDTLDDGRRLVHAGQLFEPGEIRIAPGTTHETPTLYLTAVEGDPEAAAARFRSFVARSLVPWPAGEMTARPVTLNTWEGNYFDHRLEALKAQADAAAALGIERYVLDDGWFGRRDDDTSSLGDWQVDARKYPDGLGPLVDHVTGLGMQFGIWFEPEMVNPESELYRRHPDWVLKVDGRPLLTSRHQLVLDLTRREVSDYLFDCIDAVLGEHAVSYVKWDMNRDLTHAGGADGRAATTRQVRAVYALMDRVRAAHPAVEIESCASGGGRMDFGVLERTHRVWTSDGTDALERLEIQRGAAHFLPPQIMGAHVSAAPNHQTHRRHTLSFRALVALAFHMGVELDPTKMSAEDSAELGNWIALHKKLRPLFHGDGFFQLEPLDGRYCWGAVSADRIALIVAQGPQMMSEQPPPLKLPACGARAGFWRVAGLHPARPEFQRIGSEQAELLGGRRNFSIAALRRIGLTLPALMPESGVVIELERITGGMDG